MTFGPKVTPAPATGLLRLQETADELTTKARGREATALSNMIAYADLLPSGPLADDNGFGLRLRLAAAEIKRHLDPAAWDRYDYVGFPQLLTVTR